MTELCPCGSNNNYANCCGPFINGEQLPRTALALMRSRYSAYCKKNAEYLIDSWHPECNMNSHYSSIIASFEQTQWTGLKIINPGQGSDLIKEDFVEFIAHFVDTQTSRTSIIHERSRFLLSENKWYYIDGVKPSVGRNDPCPCGSSKKYKKCCSA